MKAESLKNLIKKPMTEVIGGVSLALAGVVSMNSAPTHNTVVRGVEIGAAVIGFVNFAIGSLREMDQNPSKYWQSGRGS